MNRSLPPPPRIQAFVTNALAINRDSRWWLVEKLGGVWGMDAAKYMNGAAFDFGELTLITSSSRAPHAP